VVTSFHEAPDGISEGKNQNKKKKKTKERETRSNWSIKKVTNKKDRKDIGKNLGAGGALGAARGLSGGGRLLKATGGTEGETLGSQRRFPNF